MILNNEIIKNILKENNCNLIGEIKSYSEKLTIVDNNGYIFYMTMHNFIQSSKVVQFNSNNPYTIENIKTWTKNNNYNIELLSQEFINSTTDLEWKCNRCGKLFSRSWKNMKDKLNGKYCSECNKKDRENHQKLTFKNNLENYIDDIKNLGYKVFRDDYTNKNKPITIMDSNGFLYYKSYNQCLKDELNKVEHANPYSIYNIKHRHSYEYVKSIIEAKGYKLLSTKYNNKKQSLNVIDEEGYKYRVDLGQIENSNTLLKFYETNPYTIDNIKNYIILNNIETELISTNYKGSDKILIWRCLCGELFETTWSRFYTQHQIRCKKCSRVQSKIENKTETWLKNNNLTYTYQFRFEDCRDKKVLPFDFAIFDDENKLKHIIECDGKQHYERVKWSELMTDEQIEIAYQSTQLHDRLKNEYCKENKINLIRIPYWEFKNNNYINILENKAI